MFLHENTRINLIQCLLRDQSIYQPGAVNNHNLCIDKKRQERNVSDKHNYEMRNHVRKLCDKPYLPSLPRESSCVTVMQGDARHGQRTHRTELSLSITVLSTQLRLIVIMFIFTYSYFNINLPYLRSI